MGDLSWLFYSKKGVLRSENGLPGLQHSPREISLWSRQWCNEISVKNNHFQKPSLVSSSGIGRLNYPEDCTNNRKSFKTFYFALINCRDLKLLEVGPVSYDENFLSAKSSRPAQYAQLRIRDKPEIFSIHYNRLAFLSYFTILFGGTCPQFCLKLRSSKTSRVSRFSYTGPGCRDSRHSVELKLYQ